MAFKLKLKSFFKSGRGGGTIEETPTAPDAIIVPEIKEDRRENPMEIEEILKSIDEEYYSEPSFDATDYTLQTIPREGVSVSSIDELRIRLRLQHQAVSKKLSDLVLANHEAFVEELRRVTEIENVLQSAKGICVTGRRHLANARQGVAIGGISILAKHRKRQKVLSVLQSLKTIKTLQKTDEKLREILEEENYPAAVQLCLECQQAASTFREYTCVSELSTKLQETQDQIEEQLDKALEKICFGFDMHHYENVQTAYRLLGKTQTAVDQLHMHFTTAIHSTSFKVVLKYAEKSAGQVADSLQRTLYADLCQKLDATNFLPGLVNLCKSLWEIMRSYYHVMRWHEQFDRTTETAGSTDKLDELDDEWVETDSPLSLPKETSFNRQYIKNKLEHGVKRVWQDVQQRVKPYLLGTDLSSFHIDSFIHILGTLDKLMSIGEELSGSESKDLQESIRLQSFKYFKVYHRARLEELRMFLENEGWEACPVRATFSVLQLHEFRFLRPAIKNEVNLAEMTASANATAEGTGWFARFALHGNPFDETRDEDEEEIMTNEETEGQEEEEEEEDMSEELKQEYVDERTGEAPGLRRPSGNRLRPVKRQSSELRGPILTNATLMIVRFFGKYMQMMNLLKPIAFDVMQSMSQLFDFYLYTINAFFASDRNDSSHFGLSSRMMATLERISGLILSPHEGSPSSPVSPDNVKIHGPRVSEIVQLYNPLNLFGLTERLVAVESLVYLATQFDLLRPHLESLIPQSKRAFLTQFYSQTVSIAHEIRKPVYRGVADRALDLEKVLSRMNQVKWDVKEIMSQHSPYVDLLLEEFRSFKERLHAAEQRLALPSEGREMMWTHTIRLANRTFVEGFAGVKKCSNEGRALMQLDFQQFLVKLEQLTNIRPIPDKQYVEMYIKAYYLAEADLEQWLRTHKEYSTKHLASLVSSGMGGHLGRKSKQRLLSLIEEVDKSRR